MPHTRKTSVTECTLWKFRKKSPDDDVFFSRGGSKKAPTILQKRKKRETNNPTANGFGVWMAKPPLKNWVEFKAFHQPRSGFLLLNASMTRYLISWTTKWARSRRREKIPMTANSRLKFLRLFGHSRNFVKDYLGFPLNGRRWIRLSSLSEFRLTGDILALMARGLKHEYGFIRLRLFSPPC